MERNRHVGRTILLIVLAIILLIPVGIFGYLTLSSFHTAERLAAFNPQDGYEGTPAIHGDGSVSIPLKEQDVFWMLEQYDLLEEYIPAGYKAMIKGYGLDFQKDGLELYVDAKLFNFLPVPLHISVSAAYRSDNSVEMLINSVHIGKLIKVPIEKISAIDLSEPLWFSLNDLETGGKITSVKFEQDQAVVSETFMEQFGGSLMDGIQSTGYVQSLYLYEGDEAIQSDPVMGLLLGPEPLSGGYDLSLQDVMTRLPSFDFSNKTLADLLALCSEERLSQLLDSQKEFERHFILAPTVNLIGSAQKDYGARVANNQRQYETMLSSLRQKYRNGELTLDNSSLLDTATGQVFSLSSLAPDLVLNEADCRVALLYSYDALNAVKTSDMPLLRDVPAKNKSVTAGIYQDIPYDLGIFMTMPCGLKVCLYYQANDQFIINAVDAELWESVLYNKRLPVIMSDTIPRPPVRPLRDAPEGDLSSYAILIPLAQ